MIEDTKINNGYKMNGVIEDYLIENIHMFVSKDHRLMTTPVSRQ